jgi:hypothetical protein
LKACKRSGRHRHVRKFGSHSFPGLAAKAARIGTIARHATKVAVHAQEGTSKNQLEHDEPACLKAEEKSDRNMGCPRLFKKCELGA